MQVSNHMGKLNVPASSFHNLLSCSFIHQSCQHHKLMKIIDLYSDKPYSRMKPGQTQLDRDYYKDATAEHPDGGKVLSNYGRF